jgi:hypothetical protein
VSTIRKGLLDNRIPEGRLSFGDLAELEELEFSWFSSFDSLIGHSLFRNQIKSFVNLKFLFKSKPMNKVGRVLNFQNSLRKQLLLINEILEQNKAKVE